MLSDVSAFADYLAIYERKAGLPTARVQNSPQVRKTILPFLNQHTQFGKETIQNSTPLPCGSHVSNHPRLSFDYNMETNQRELKRNGSSRWLRPNYISERIMATAKDGTQILYLSSTNRGWKRMVKHLYCSGYAAYGMNYPASFSSTRLSLLNRG